MISNVLYTLFGLIFLVGMARNITDFYSVLVYCFTEDKRKFETSNIPWLIGAIGLLVTYLWF